MIQFNVPFKIFSAHMRRANQYTVKGGSKNIHATDPHFLHDVQCNPNMYIGGLNKNQVSGNPLGYKYTI